VNEPKRARKPTHLHSRSAPRWIRRDKTGHPVVATANKRRICAGNGVLSTGIRVISVQRELSAYRASRCTTSRCAPPPTAEIFSLSFSPLFHSLFSPFSLSLSLSLSLARSILIPHPRPALMHEYISTVSRSPVSRARRENSSNARV